MSKIKRLGNIYNNPNGYKSQAGRVYDKIGLAPCLKTPSGGGKYTNGPGRQKDKEADSKRVLPAARNTR